MKIKTLFIIMTIGGIVTGLLSVLLGKSASWTLPAPFPVYLIVLFVIMLLTLAVEYCVYRTNQIINEISHFTIRARDIIHIPWEIEIEVKEEEEGKTNIKTVNIGTLAVVMTGGLEYWAFSDMGKVTDPIWIFPSYLLGKEGNNWISYANLDYCPFDEASQNIQEKLLLINETEEFQGRFDPEKTPIWIGYAGHLDGSNTPENLYKQRKDRKENKTITTLTELNKELHTQLRQMKETKEKTYYLGPGYKEVEKKED